MCRALFHFLLSLTETKHDPVPASNKLKKFRA